MPARATTLFIGWIASAPPGPGWLRPESVSVKRWWSNFPTPRGHLEIPISSIRNPTAGRCSSNRSRPAEPGQTSQPIRWCIQNNETGIHPGRDIRAARQCPHLRFSGSRARVGRAGLGRLCGSLAAGSKRPSRTNRVGVRRRGGLVDDRPGNPMAAQPPDSALLALTALYALGVIFLHVPRVIAHPSVFVSWSGAAEQLAIVAGGLVAYAYCTQLGAVNPRASVQDWPPSLWRMALIVFAWPTYFILLPHGRTDSQVAPAGTNILGLRHSGRTLLRPGSRFSPASSRARRPCC